MLSLAHSRFALQRTVTGQLYRMATPARVSFGWTWCKYTKASRSCSVDGDVDKHSRSSEILRLYVPVESGNMCPFEDNSASLFFACTWASRSSCEPFAMCLSTFTEGPHSSREVAVSFRACVAGETFFFLGGLEPRSLSFEEPFTSFPSKVEAIPCIDDHDTPQNPPVNPIGEASEPPSPRLAEDLLFHCGLSADLMSDVEREGCVAGSGEGALELNKDEVADS